MASTNKRIVAGIDIGTSKITTIIASLPDEGPVRVSGVATSTARGVRKGQIVDIEEATTSITESLEAAERMAGYSISSAYLSVGGAHVSSQNSHGVVAVAEPNKEITPEDVRRAVEAARAISLPATKEILHVIPREFIVDSQEGIKDPVGMTGVRLEVNTHLITVNSTVLRNLEKCASLVGIDVNGFVFGGLAASTSVLTETEKELGVVVIDIGAGTVDLCIFVDGALSYSSVLPFGARNITNDLAIGLKISLESAEKIKMLLNKKSGELLSEEKPVLHVKKEKGKDPDDQIDISSLTLPEGVNRISKRTLIDGIIRPRLTEMFTMIGIEIKKSGLLGMTPSGIVVTGGGAETIGLVDAARRNLAMQVRIGNPGFITGLIDEITTPSYASVVGLVLYAQRVGAGNKEKFAGGQLGKLAHLPVGGIAGKVVDLFKSFLP
ncbi:cell division protein FtsA [Candidatus Gottesmanbacteria bacterium RIFCSPHIGHO2_02_FULL_39_11]|uniref:Cell division protein FtsA n=1 Tax=Candidatus Gottesmanbacteria bacterium RIFCSPHIGHO2_02_FULL_39_11 TaxID=1798382 RepID=A0A1F5ZUW9_9BACT|nr:MAG: cell division protein FtsA [Candidatus Gottesmanbacteria bacterium RIFCSPHIGHO2_02_FULL_39_11]